MRVFDKTNVNDLGSILMIDDNEHLRQFSAAILERAGHTVIQAGDASEAAEIWLKDRATISLLIADILLPGLSGPEIALEFRSEKPDLKIIFTSGNHQETVRETTHLVRGARFLPKPYSAKLMLDTVLAILES